MIFRAILTIILYSNFASSTVFTDPTEYQERVAWGQYVYTEGAYPYYLSMQKPVGPNSLIYQHVCGGSLIRERIMITAAHCLLNTTLNPMFRIYPNYRNTPIMLEQDLYFKITSYVIHPRQNFASSVDPFSKHDIAVILLDKADPRTGAVIELPSIPLYHCTLMTIMGFGITESGDLPYRLKEAHLYTLSDQECIWETPTVGYAPVLNICATNKYGSSACPGDSGGPLVWDNPRANKSFIYGVVSNGEWPCSRNKVTVFVNVFTQLNFVNHAILRLAHDELRSNQYIGQIELTEHSMNYK